MLSLALCVCVRGVCVCVSVCVRASSVTSSPYTQFSDFPSLGPVYKNTILKWEE